MAEGTGRQTALRRGGARARRRGAARHEARAEGRAVDRPVARAILDPNVLVSARLSPGGTPARLLEAAEEGRFDLVISNHLLEEVRDVLGRPKMRRYLPEEAVPIYLERLRSTAVLAENPAVSGTDVTPDPDDDYLIALAAAGDASYLVSGDRHLLGLPNRLARDGEGHTLARVLTPREFLEELERSA